MQTRIVQFENQKKELKKQLRVGSDHSKYLNTKQAQTINTVDNTVQQLIKFTDRQKVVKKVVDS